VEEVMVVVEENVHHEVADLAVAVKDDIVAVAVVTVIVEDQHLKMTAENHVTKEDIIAVKQLNQAMAAVTKVVQVKEPDAINQATVSSGITSANTR